MANIEEVKSELVCGLDQMGESVGYLEAGIENAGSIDSDIQAARAALNGLVATLESIKQRIGNDMESHFKVASGVATKGLVTIRSTLQGSNDAYGGAIFESMHEVTNGASLSMACAQSIGMMLEDAVKILQPVDRTLGSIRGGVAVSTKHANDSKEAQGSLKDAVDSYINEH